MAIWFGFEYILTVFAIIEKIDKAAESKSHCTLLDKMGGCFHGIVSDTWVRLSGGKMRGKIVFDSVEKGSFEVDVNDILDLRFESK